MLTPRQDEIIEIVKKKGPITSEAIANLLGFSRSAIRNDLAVLGHLGIIDAKPKVGYTFIKGARQQTFYDFASRTGVKKIMSRPVSMPESKSAYEGIVQMFIEDVGTLFCTKNGYLSGVVSRKDFLKAQMGEVDLEKVPLSMLMTRMPNIHVALSHDTVMDVARSIIDHQIDALPVVEEEGEELRIIGRVSKTNITAFVVDSLLIASEEEEE